MRGFGERLHFFIRPICRFCDTVSVCRDYHRSKRPPFLRSESREKFCWVGGCYESFLSQPSEDSVFRHCRRHRCLLLSVLVPCSVRAVLLRVGHDARELKVLPEWLVSSSQPVAYLSLVRLR